jgi:hypothetical protein
MPDLKHYIHENGRRCQKDPLANIWRHWDHEQPEPGPHDVRDYVCHMDHWVHLTKNGPLPPLPDDRGNFGMPTVGDPEVAIFAKDAIRGGELTIKPGRLMVVMPGYKMEITQHGLSIDYGENGVSVNAETPEAEYILAKVLPTLLQGFLEKNAKYARAQTGHDLGAKGIIPDINRKTSVLISRLWDAAPAGSGEPTEEVIDDLIGHLLLMRAKLAKDHE